MPHCRFKRSPSRKRKSRSDHSQPKEDQWHCSVSQCTIHQDSLCNVSGYEVNAHCRGSLPELFCCDGRGGINGWLYKEDIANNPCMASCFKREKAPSPHTSDIKMELDDNYINLGDLEALHLVLKKNGDKDSKASMKKARANERDRSRGKSPMSIEELEASRCSSGKKIKHSESRKLRLERFLSDVDEERLDPSMITEQRYHNLDDILEELHVFIQSNKMDKITENQRAQLIDYLTILSDEYDNKIKIGSLKYELKDQFKNHSNC